MHSIDADSVQSAITGTQYPGMRALNDAKRRFLSICASTENQDCLRERSRHHDFIVNRIVSKTVHRAADQRFLTFERADRWSIFLRQPGESRNLRMNHSVGHEYLFAFAVVNQRLCLAEFQ